MKMIIMSDNQVKILGDIANEVKSLIDDIIIVEECDLTPDVANDIYDAIEAHRINLLKLRVKYLVETQSKLTHEICSGESE